MGHREKPFTAAAPERAQGRLVPDQASPHEDSRSVVGNHSGYGHEGAANFEHDDTGGLHNYSGMEDELFSAAADNDGWEEGYDY